MPLVSVVIPTRNRLEYLKGALESALGENAPDMEVIVADNATDDGTQAYLASLGDRVKVTRSETPLSMTDNWYRALELVTGDWVIFIGDDDCLIPGFMRMVRLIDKTLEASGVDLVTWPCPSYRWPDAVSEKERNYLKFAVKPVNKLYDSAPALRSLFENINNIMAPPGLYHSLSRRSLIDKVKSNFGEYRLGMVPDLGSGLLYLAHTNQHLMMGHPLTVMGFSKKSTGMAFKIGGKDNAPAEDFRKLSNMNELKKYIPEIEDENADVGQWRLLTQWRDYFATKGMDFKLNDKKMLVHCLSRLWALPEDQREKSGAGLITYGVKMGLDRGELEKIAAKARSHTQIFNPMLEGLEGGGVRACVDLTETETKTALGAARLIRGFQPK